MSSELSDHGGSCLLHRHIDPAASMHVVLAWRALEDGVDQVHSAYHDQQTGQSR